MVEIIISGKEGLKFASAKEFGVELKKLFEGNSFKDEKVKSIYFKNNELVIEVCSE